MHEDIGTEALRSAGWCSTNVCHLESKRGVRMWMCWGLPGSSVGSSTGRTDSKTRTNTYSTGIIIVKFSEDWYFLPKDSLVNFFIAFPFFKTLMKKYILSIRNSYFNQFQTFLVFRVWTTACQTYQTPLTRSVRGTVCALLMSEKKWVPLTWFISSLF